MFDFAGLSAVPETVTHGRDESNSPIGRFERQGATVGTGQILIETAWMDLEKSSGNKIQSVVV
jgi:hypothetical protein